MTFPYGIASEYEPTDQRGRCCVRACAYPGLGFKIYDGWRGTIERKLLCVWHFLTGASPFSMEYEDADALLSIPRPKTRRAVFIPNPNYNKTRMWKDDSLERVTAKFDQLFKIPATSRVAIEDNQAGTPIANHNQTGAFILWKGYGKRKVRKVQRNRPQGWHGNHPEQKPLKVSRETLDDVPIWTPPTKEATPRIENIQIEELVEDLEREELASTIEEDWTSIFAALSDSPTDQRQDTANKKGVVRK